MQPYYAIYCGECGALLRPISDQPEDISDTVAPSTLMPEPMTVDPDSVVDKLRAANRKDDA